MIRGASLRSRIERVGEHPAGESLLFVLAVLEACVFPMPTEAAFVALALALPARAWRLAAIATSGSLVGAVIGYALGAQLFASVGQPLLQSVGLLDDFSSLGEIYRGNVWLALGTSGYTPIPFVLYTYAAGANDLSMATFMLASLIGRGVKFALLGSVTLFGGRMLVRLSPRYLLALVIGVGLAWWMLRSALGG